SHNRMAEQPRMGEQPEKPKIIASQICLETVKKSSGLPSSMPSSPIALTKTTSVRYNCLCSPTTHAGSFRCRYHRSASLTRSSISVGSKLSELAGKSPGSPLHAHCWMEPKYMFC
ncbi:unnamed protein product, partial [Ilex paraguariensis]